MLWLVAAVPVLGLLGYWFYERSRGAAPAPAPAPVGLPPPSNAGVVTPEQVVQAAAPPALKRIVIVPIRLPPHLMPIRARGPAPAPAGPSIPAGVPAPPFNLHYPGSGAWQTNHGYIQQYQGALKFLSWAMGAVGDANEKIIAPSLSPGAVDGSYGHATSVAVAAFQRYVGQTPDGQAGSATAAALASKVAEFAAKVGGTAHLAPPAPAPAPAPAPSPGAGGNYNLMPGTFSLGLGAWFFNLPAGASWEPGAMSCPSGLSPLLMGSQAILDTKGQKGTCTFAWTTSDGTTQTATITFA